MTIFGGDGVGWEILILQVEWGETLMRTQFHFISCLDIIFTSFIRFHSVSALGMLKFRFGLFRLS